MEGCISRNRPIDKKVYSIANALQGKFRSIAAAYQLAPAINRKVTGACSLQKQYHGDSSARRVYNIYIKTVNTDAQKHKEIYYGNL
jgi:hypothetical protein